MARNVENLPEGIRLTDYMGFGVIARTFPLSMVSSVLGRTNKKGVRKRDLPANVMMYYIIVNALYSRSSSREVLRCLLEGIQWLADSRGTVKVPGKSGISQARARLGLEPVRELHDAIVRPIASPSTRRAWYRDWHLVSLDTGTLTVGDDPSNVKAFGRHRGGRESSARPRIRFVSLVEYGTHVLFGSQMGPHQLADHVLAGEVLPSLRQNMLCLAGQRFFDFDLWLRARETGADLLWKGNKSLLGEDAERLSDGSYLGLLYPGKKDKRHGAGGVAVRVIKYPASGVEQEDDLLITSILDHERAHADRLIDLYDKRCPVESALEKMNSYMSGANIGLRSKKPELVQQEFYGMMMAHFAVRQLIHGSGEVDDDVGAQISSMAIEGSFHNEYGCD